MTEKEQKIFEIQCESTQKLMLAQRLRDPADDYDYILKIKTTPVTKDAQCVKEDGTVDLNVRFISQAEGKLHEEARYKRGEIIAGLRNEPAPSTLTEEKRDRGTAAFMRALSLDAVKNKFKAMMRDLFKPSHAEIMAESIRKVKE